MKISVCFVCFITVFAIPNTNSQDSSPAATVRVPGCSACYYYGSIMEYCSLATVPISSLPKECSSLLFYGLVSDSNYNITDSVGGEDLKYLQCVVNSDFPSFIYYGHASLEHWIDALKCNTENDGENAKAEMKSLKVQLDQYPKLSGLILNSLDINPDSPNFPNFTENFLVYLNEMRSTFPNLGIGIEINAGEMINYYDSNCSLEWLDFNALDPCVDFYIFSFNMLNLCTEKFKIGGTTPVDGDYNHTITKLANYAVEAGIPTSKMYFGYRTGPNSIDQASDPCILTNAKLCASSNLDGWCSDTTQSYYDKGEFAKKNGAGFVAYQVDMDDPDGCCQCHPYPAFYDILAGYNGDTPPAPCPLLDKS